MSECVRVYLRERERARERESKNKRERARVGRRGGLRKVSGCVKE